jgi:hypothetical protein
MFFKKHSTEPRPMSERSRSDSASGSSHLNIIPGGAQAHAASLRAPTMMSALDWSSMRLAEC